MEKLLSIVIPSYNMEAYLNRCLDSLIIDDERLMSQLDIIVVNDGSKDKTSEIAHSYAELFPASIRVIDKPNGHYGSCINAALKIAEGKYFRILDADDWYDNDALRKFLSLIATIDCDVIYTHYTMHINGKTVDSCVKSKSFGQIYSLDDFDFEDMDVQMHMIAYRTTLLKEIQYKQTEGISYTDTEFTYFPQVVAKSVVFFDLSLYQYYFGREDQSMNYDVLLKGRFQLAKVAETILNDKTYLTKGNSLSRQVREILLGRIFCSFLFPIFIMNGEIHSEKEYQWFKSLLFRLKETDPIIYQKLDDVTVKGIHILKLWIKNRRIASVILYIKRKYLKLIGRKH